MGGRGHRPGRVMSVFFNLWRALSGFPFWNIRPYSNLWHAIWTSLAFVVSLVAWIFWDINFPPFFLATVVFGMLAIGLWIAAWNDRRVRYYRPRWDPLTPFPDSEGRPPNDPDYTGWEWPPREGGIEEENDPDYTGWNPDGGPSRDEVDRTNDPKG